ncbi:hypothetical protein C0Q70_09920 [Pomacea canaliculata]|uniref:Parathyroid hormone/parathyroid hormone-related peptide receptor n=1 Tax=Pomacea canaliculata TaxID=400727 RepID=A0A2T7PB55_POMCA|nr:hypothetical protein C0Q70_09920 [Pomacea canaliculata]
MFVLYAGLRCNATWDSIMCWPQTMSGETAVQPCPDYVHGFYTSGFASRQCMDDGSWFVNPIFNTSWTNYTQCTFDSSEPQPHVSETNTWLNVDLLTQAHLNRIKVMYNLGYGVSLAALTIAIFIMIYFRRLHCPRNTVHLNLFSAFLLRAVLSFLRDNLLVAHLGLPDDVMETVPGAVVFRDDGSTHWKCKLLFAAFNYVLAASCMWIFVEGLYLHTLIIVAVFSEKNHIRWYILLGWGGPLVFIVPWVVLRATVEDTYCWNTHPTIAIFWIIKGPLLLAVAVNFVFFVNIVRVLFTKLVKTAPPKARRFRYRRMAKSTLVLIPLFGVHYIVFLGLPERISLNAELVKLYYEMFFNSFQGFFVASLFCFMNGEVKAEIRKKWIRYKLRTNSRKFQKVYWKTSSSQLTRKRSRSHENSSSLEKRDSKELYSSSSESPIERHRFKVHIQNLKYNCHNLHPDMVVNDVKPIIYYAKRNSFV